MPKFFSIISKHKVRQSVRCNIKSPSANFSYAYCSTPFSKQFTKISNISFDQICSDAAASHWNSKVFLSSKKALFARKCICSPCKFITQMANTANMHLHSRTERDMLAVRMLTYCLSRMAESSNATHRSVCVQQTARYSCYAPIMAWTGVHHAHAAECGDFFFFVLLSLKSRTGFICFYPTIQIGNICII